LGTTSISDYDFDGKNRKVAMVGERDYGSSDEQKIIFNQSAGFVLSYNFVTGGVSFAPFCPTSFKIEEIDAYGAVKYNNKWLGLRFYKYQ
jgi:hypothetical protein